MKENVQWCRAGLITSVFCSCFGISSVVNSLGNWARSEDWINGGFILIAFGVGILRGKAGHLGCLMTLLGFFIVAGLGVMIMDLFSEEAPKAEWSYLGVVGLLVLVAVYSICVLGVAPDKGLSEEDEGRFRILIPVTVVLSFVLSGLSELDRYHRAQLLDEVFRYDFDVIVKDAKTGELLKNASLRYPAHNLEDLDVPGWMKSTGSYGPKSDEATHRLQGFALGSADFEVSSEGFEPKRVPVDKDTSSVVEVLLNTSE